MDQHDGGRNATQPPAKDFLALTHGQEWVNFYESFDKLVQDHLSRSSELLRRAMSLPEVADREVAQVRAEMEGKLAAERERSHDLLAQLHTEISHSRDHVASLAATVNDVAAGLTSLSARVSTALTSLNTPAGQPTPLAATAMATTEPVVEAAASPVETPTNVVATEEMAPEAVAVVAEAETIAESADDIDEPIAVESEVEEIVAPIDAEPAFQFESETGLDLSALAEAEASDESNDLDSISDDLVIEAERPQTASLEEEEVVGVSASDRPRPHWLSVTRIGSRP